ncbi:MAG: MBL fold metallo-hydrolase [Verrucomicrobiota bacterium]
MKITNLNPKPDIGASAWFADLEGHGLLMDAGTHPKYDGTESLPLYNLIERQDVDAIAISHCHHDHIGSLPIAMRQFPKAHVLLSELSYFLVERVLHNSVNVMTRQRDEYGIKEYPFYSHDELDDLAPRFQGFRYNREIEWGSFKKARIGVPSPTLEFFDAGHALGSAGLMVRGEKQTLFYTGDVCFHDQTILKAARFEDVQADVLLMETTRGNRASQPEFSRDKEVERFSAALEAVIQRKGCVLIPTFALGRTQEVLAILSLLLKSGRLKPQPIYIGGLGRVFTEIYDLQAHRTHRQHSNLQLHEALNLTVLEKKQAESMKLTGGRIFVLTAGMMSEHTSAHDVGMRMISDERQAIFFVGYTDPSTPGGALRQAKPGETFRFSPLAGEVTRRCEIQDFDFTAHAQREDLLEFVGRVNPRTVLLGHGDDSARQWMEEQIRVRWPKMKVIQPKPGETVEV